MRKVLFLGLALVCTLALSAAALENDLDFSPEQKRIGTIVTCLAGFHTGDNDVPNDSEQDITGFLASLSAELPISSSSRFLVNVRYDRMSFTPDVFNGYKWKTTESLLTVTGGFRFFIFADKNIRKWLTIKLKLDTPEKFS